MIRDYLGRVSVAATKVLPKGDRMLFVGRTRAALEAKVGPLASADADVVLDALRTMGDPDELANQERERLYSARRRGAAAAPPTLWKPSKESRRGASGSRRGAAETRRGATPPPAREQGPSQGRRRPWPHRGLTGPDEPQPAGDTSPSASPDAVPAVPRQADSPEGMSTPVEASPPPEVSPPQAPREEVPRPRMPPEQALEEGWPVEPAPTETPPADPGAAEAAPAEPAPADPGAAEAAAAGNAPAAGVPVPDPAGLEAAVPEAGAPKRDVPETGVPADPETPV